MPSKIKRFASYLLRPLGHQRHLAQPPTAKREDTLLPDALYCGDDHWQNLLAAPLDARHYLLENWCGASFAVPGTDCDTAPFSPAQNRHLGHR